MSEVFASVGSASTAGLREKLKDAVPVIFDPASFYGHDEFEFGIINMFGGFDEQFFDGRSFSKTGMVCCVFEIYSSELSFNFYCIANY